MPGILERTDLAMRFFEADDYAAIQAITTPVSNALYLALDTVADRNDIPGWVSGTVYYFNGTIWNIYGGPRNFPH